MYTHVPVHNQINKSPEHRRRPEGGAGRAAGGGLRGGHIHISLSIYLSLSPSLSLSVHTIMYKQQ